MRIVVFDLDDTLVAKEITREVNERSYGSSLKKAKGNGDKCSRRFGSLFL